MSWLARLRIFLSTRVHDTRTKSSDCAAKHGAGRHPQYPRKYMHQVHVPPYHRTQLQTLCSKPRSLWGKVWIQRPVLPWSVDSCGQPPNLKSPSSCALSSRVHCQFLPILPLLPSLARSCESRLAHSVPSRPESPDCLVLVLSAHPCALVRVRSNLSDFAVGLAGCAASAPHLHKVD